MKGMFSNATAFNQDITNWNVTHVTDMSSMFSATSLFGYMKAERASLLEKLNVIIELANEWELGIVQFTFTQLRTTVEQCTSPSFEEMEFYNKEYKQRVENLKSYNDFYFDITMRGLV